MSLYRSAIRSERGAALVEMAMTLPLLMLISVGIVEFGRAYQTWQVLTNAAREGARVAVLPGVNDDAVTGRVQDYLEAGKITDPDSAIVVIDRNNVVAIGATNASASSVKVDYPFQFMVLQPIAQLVANGSNLGGPLTMSASATMRNE
jgi:Flp pilus assembly protein TadG